MSSPHVDVDAYTTVGGRAPLGMHTHASALLQLQPGKASAAYIVAGAASSGVAVWVWHCVGNTTGYAKRAWCIVEQP
jgi:hypothetical protein